MTCLSFLKTQRNNPWNERELVALTTVVFKPSWFKVEWWADVEDVRVSAIAEMRDAEFGSGRREGAEACENGCAWIAD